VRDIGLHGSYECLVIITIEELDLDRGLPAQACRAQPMHPVNDAHRLPVHKNRRPAIPHFRESLNVVKILTAEPGRICGSERGSGNRSSRDTAGHLEGSKTSQILRTGHLSD